MKSSIFKTIYKYALPNVISMWVFTLYSIIDGIFISRFIGELGLAGVNLTFPLINLIFSISIMIGVGSSTLISIKFGENKITEGNNLLTLASFLNLILGFLISLIILLNIEKVINILGTNKSEEVYIYTKDYLSVIILFSVFYMSGYAFEIFIKVDGKPSYPLFCVLIGGITNIILDYILVVIFPYGVKGAAFATGISQVITCSMLFFYIKFKAKKIKFLMLKEFSLKKIFSILKIGFSEFITEISSGILILIYNWVILAKIGIYGVSIYGVVSYITSFIVLTMIGFGQGIQPIISYNFGKKDKKTLNLIFKFSLFSVFFLGVFFFIFINIFSLKIGSIFFKNFNLIQDIKKVLDIYSFCYLLLGINIFISSYFTAIKKVFYSAIISLSRGILLNFLFLVFLPIKFGENGIWFSAVFSELTCLFISIILLLRIKKSKIIY